MRFYFFAGSIAFAVTFIAYLLLWPVPIQPQAWRPPEIAPLTGSFASNSRLRQARTTEPLGAVGPEDIAFAPDGKMATGLEDGSVVLFDPESGNRSVLANTGGRPLGMMFDSSGYLVVADADRGLLRLSPDGEIEELIQRAEGVNYADDLDIGSDGTIYLSDASSKYDRFQFAEEILEHEPYGRLLAFNPQSREFRVLLDGLYFANGVVLAADESYILVSESGASRIRRYWISGERRGEDEIFIANLPGYPDNINRGTTTAYWLALPLPRIWLVDRLAGSPLLTKMLYRLRPLLIFAVDRHSIVLGIDEQGGITHNLQDESGRYSEVTSVMQRDGTLWIGNLVETAPLKLVLDEYGS